MTNPTDYRALCAELSFIWGRSTNPDDLFENMIPLVDRARAALAQPELEAPTDEELLDLYGVATPSCHIEEYRRELDYGRAVLARWGTPAIEPVSQS